MTETEPAPEPAGQPPISHRRESRRRAGVIVVLAVLAVVTGVLSALALQRGDGAESQVQRPPAETAEPAPVPEPSEAEPASEPEPEPEPEPAPEPEPEPAPEPEPPARTLDVMVLNATRISGLAARTTGEVTNAGWNVVGSGNARGSYPGDTIYYPAGGQAEAQQLGADLGIGRLMPNLAGMPENRLTVVLTSGR